jgi:non-heme chloroperoxidase
MSTLKAEDGAAIYFKDWGPRDALPLVFHHGWPLSADDWDNQMLFFLNQGYRVIAPDRRGHGRSEQTDAGHTMETYAADAGQLARHLNLKNAVHIGHSAGGGEVARYVAHADPKRVAKAVLISAVTPIMVRSEKNPQGVPLEVFDGFREAIIDNRSQFCWDVASGPFYGYNRAGAAISTGLIQNWWRQGMMGAGKAHYDCVKALSETDFTEDLRSIDVPVLVLHGEDDQIVPLEMSSRKAVELLRKGELKTYPGYPHGMCQTHADRINADLLAFIRSRPGDAIGR